MLEPFWHSSLTDLVLIFVWWFQLHGTYRKKDRIYRENYYYGQGKSLAEADAKELAEEVEERKSENPLAFDSNKHEFELKKEEVAVIKKTQ